jgi:hypothetical protein
MIYLQPLHDIQLGPLLSRYSAKVTSKVERLSTSPGAIPGERRPANLTEVPVKAGRDFVHPRRAGGASQRPPGAFRPFVPFAVSPAASSSSRRGAGSCPLTLDDR